MKKPTVDELKRWLFKLGIKHGVAPRLISERLLSADDKTDMLAGQIGLETVDCAVAIWKANGMCDYVKGQIEPYKPTKAFLNKR